MFILFHFRLHQICHSQCLKSGSWEYICPLTTGSNRINLFKFKYKCLISIHQPQSVTARKESFYCSLKHHIRTACTQESGLGQTVPVGYQHPFHFFLSNRTSVLFGATVYPTKNSQSPSEDWPCNPKSANGYVDEVLTKDIPSKIKMQSL